MCGAAALAIAGVLLLSACTGTSIPAPPAPTESQIDSLMTVWPGYEANIIRSGAAFTLEGASFVRFVPDAAWYQTMTRCTAALGRTTVDANDICLIEYPPESVRDRLKTPRQLDYIYSYYVGELVPCMRARGYAPSKLPTRSSFHTLSRNGLTLWSPYATLGSDAGELAALQAGFGSAGAAIGGTALPPRLVALVSQCPALPAGV